MNIEHRETRTHTHIFHAKLDDEEEYLRGKAASHLGYFPEEGKLVVDLRAGQVCSATATLTIETKEIL